jgi:hypothetical protein
MKTDRLTLLISPADKALIHERAAQMGVSASEFVRRAVELFDPADAAALAELETLLPELEAMAGRLEREKVDQPRRSAERDAERLYYASDAYRDEVQRQILADPTIDWRRARQFFGNDRQAAA